jgi:adenylate cyclase
MGLFGALTPVDEEGHLDAVGAVHAAVVLRERFAALQEKWLQKWTLHAPQMIDIGLGAGIHTGEVLVGNIGATSRNQFTAIGPNVNFAQRLESRSAKGQILVSASTEARVRDHFKLEEVEAISDIKNIQGEFRLYQVISSRL